MSGCSILARKGGEASEILSRFSILSIIVTSKRSSDFFLYKRSEQVSILASTNPPCSSRANANVRQSWLDSGLGSQVKGLGDFNRRSDAGETLLTRRFLTT